MKLNDYNILIKLVIILFIGMSTLMEGKDTKAIIGLLLITIAFAILEYILKRKFEGYFLAASIVLSTLIYIYYSEAAIIFVIYSLFEFLITYKKQYITGLIIIPISILFIKNQEKLPEYLLIIVLIFIWNYYMSKSSKRLKFLEEKYDGERDKNANLSLKLKDSEKYRDQAYKTLKLEERNELSGRMHDKIGHTMAGALLQLEALKYVIDKDNSKAMEMLNSTTEVLRNGMDDIRMILREVKPTSEQLGINKIRLLMDEKIRNTSFTYTLISHGNIEIITQPQWGLIIEGIRELSTNTIKYSKCKTIDIKINVLNQIIKVEVKDNGVGIDKIKKGMGLTCIEEKVLQLRGKLILDGTKGFSAIMLLPVEGD